MNKQMLYILAVALFGNMHADSQLREQLKQAYELECKQRAYDLMLELEVPLQEAQKIIAEESTPPDYRYYEHFYKPEPLRADFPDREPLMAELPDEDPGFSAPITTQALDLVAYYKTLREKYLIIMHKEKVFTIEYVQRLIEEFSALKNQLLADADLCRAVTIRIVPFLVRILQGKDVISYIDEYLDNLQKVLR